MRLKQHGVAAWFVILAVAGVFAAPAAAAAKVTVLPDLSCETPAGPQKMDLYLPEGSGRFPGVVWMHGSGGDKAHPRDRSVCADLAGAGFIVASINYEPNNTPSPEAVVACKSAVRFLRASADKYPVDERRIGVAGVS
jgi:acetyl esterase/lipase